MQSFKLKKWEESFDTIRDMEFSGKILGYEDPAAF